MEYQETGLQGRCTWAGLGRRSVQHPLVKSTAAFPFPFVKGGMDRNEVYKPMYTDDISLTCVLSFPMGP